MSAAKSPENSISVEVFDSRGAHLAGATVEIGGTFQGSELEIGGGETDETGLLEFKRLSLTPDRKRFKIKVTHPLSASNKWQFHAWRPGDIYKIQLHDVVPPNLDPSAPLRPSWRNSIGLRGKLSWLLGILDQSITHVAANRWAYGVVGTVAAAAACVLIGRITGLGIGFVILGPILVFIGMMALFLFPQRDHESRIQRFAQNIILLTVTVAIVVLIVVGVAAAVTIVIRSGGMKT